MVGVKHKMAGKKRKFASVFTIVAVLLTVLTVNVGGAGAATTCSATSKDGLKACSADQIRAFYSSGKATSLPTGYHEGFVLLGDFYSTLLEALWGGKTFTGSTVVNHGGLSEGLTGRAYLGQSALDGKTSIIVEYPGTLFALVRDEIRLVSPGVWVGYAVLGTLTISTFGLD